MNAREGALVDVAVRAVLELCLEGTCLVIQLLIGGMAENGGEGTEDELTGAAAEDGAGLLDGEGWEVEAGHSVVGGTDDVRDGIDEGAVEVKYDCLEDGGRLRPGGERGGEMGGADGDGGGREALLDDGLGCHVECLEFGFLESSVGWIG